MATHILENVSIISKIGMLAFWTLVILFGTILPGGLWRQRKQSGFRDRTTDADGFRLHYRIGGEGACLLMLHGFTLTGEQWDSFANDFVDEYTVVIADLPGHGGSSPFPESFSFEKAALLVHGLLDKLGVKSVSGIGHSGGGMTLLHMAKQRPRRMKALVLVNAPHRFGWKGRKLARGDTWELLNPDTQNWYRKMHPGGEEQAKFVYRQYNRLADNNEDISAESLAAIPANTLLIWGDRDPFFPLELPLEMYNALPNAAMWVIPGQGHTPLWIEMGGDSGAAARFSGRVKEVINTGTGIPDLEPDPGDNGFFDLEDAGKSNRDADLPVTEDQRIQSLAE